MALFKRGAIYWCKWQIGGKQIRETTGAADREAAQEYHDRRRAELWRETKLDDTPVPTWDESVLSWIEDCGEQKKSYTTDQERLVLLTEIYTGRPISEITNDSLLDLRKQLKSGKRHKHSKRKITKRSDATCNRYLALVSVVLNYMHDKSRLPAVPKIPYFPEPLKRFDWLTREQAAYLLQELPDHLAAISRLALATGLRRSNITLMEWSEVDLKRGHAWVWPDEAKAGKPISVPLNRDALAVLHERDQLKDETGKSLRHPRWIFTFRNKPVIETTTAAWRKAIARANEKLREENQLEINPKFTFHGLRHTWASWHRMNGTPTDRLQALGAWSDSRMVERYAHLGADDLARFAHNSEFMNDTSHDTVPRKFA